MIHEYITNKRKEHPLHFTLLDPGKTSPEELINLAKQTAEAGTDGFLVLSLIHISEPTRPY